MKQALTLTTFFALCLLLVLPASAQTRRTVEQNGRENDRIRVWVRDVPETARVRVDRQDRDTRVREIERPRRSTSTRSTTRTTTVTGDCGKSKTKTKSDNGDTRIVIVEDRRPVYTPAPAPAPAPAPPTIIYRDREVPAKTRKKSKARFHLQLGGAAHYTSGGLYDELDQFDRDMTSWQGEGMVGLRFDFKRRGNANVFGVWGRQGGYTDAALTRVILDQKLPYRVDAAGEERMFREVEVGFLFREWFRVSAGQGQITFTDVTQNTQTLNYYLATTGFSFRLSRSLKWNTSLTTLFGQDFEQFAFRPSMGLAFRFNAFRM